MEQIKVHVVGIHSAERVLTALENISPPGIVRKDLADQVELFSVIAPNGLPHQLLCRAAAVHLGGIDEVHTGVDTSLESGKLLLEKMRLLPQIPSALAYGANRAPALCDKLHYRVPPSVKLW